MDTNRGLPTLDAHAHIAHTRSESELARCGGILAMTLSLEEAAQAVRRHDRAVAWGVGCHPGDLNGQRDFDARVFENLVRQSAVVGEIGLDKKSPVPFEVQLKTFRTILEIVSDNPRLVSIHSNHATAEVLEELSNRPVSVPVLHWWSASPGRTKAAVAIGCCFSINPRIAQYSIFSKLVPLDRVLIETDHDYDASPDQIPAIVESTERIVAEKYRMQAEDLRKMTWKNLRSIVQRLAGAPELPEALKPFSQGA